MSTPRFQLVPGSRLAGSAGRGGVGWRLLGANNRELGRGAAAFDDAEAALADVGRARSRATTCMSHIHHDPATGSWAWSLREGDATIAVSGRGFRHERECRYNLEQFRETAPFAPTSEAVHASFPWQREAAAVIEGLS